MTKILKIYYNEKDIKLSYWALGKEENFPPLRRDKNYNNITYVQEAFPEE